MSRLLDDVRPLLGDDTVERLDSNHVNNHAAVFPGWHGTNPAPRFGDLRWEISGVDPGKTLTHWAIRFDDMSPEWALLAREALYVHINQVQFRDRVHITSNSKLAPHAHLRASTLDKYGKAFHALERICTDHGIGLPATWMTIDVNTIRQQVVARKAQGAGRLMRLLYQVRPLLTLGGVRFDPVGAMTTHKWEGGVDYSRRLAGQGIRPELFYAIVANALFYIEHAAEDIAAAIDWRANRPLIDTPRSVQKANRANWEAAYPDHPDVINAITERCHLAVVSLGGLPASTVNMPGKSAKPGEPCMETLKAIVGLRINGRHLPVFMKARAATGEPTVPGGLPVPIRQLKRPDGTTGPWRDPFCWNAVDIERQTLIDAAKVVVMAFTAMRDTELDSIPRHNWATTWVGAPAVWSQEVKTRGGEPMKWWVNEAAMTALTVLDTFIAPDAAYLFQTTSHRRTREKPDKQTSDNWKSVQRFIRRINTDPHLRGFLPIHAGWGTLGSKEPNHSLPKISPRQFRFTLASVSNFVAFGDAGFMRQAKHARIDMSHGYMANPSRSAWADALMNTIANADAKARAELTVNIGMGVWSGETAVAGHAGRAVTRTLRDLIDNLNLAAYDENSEEPMEDQFETLVMSTPELLQALRSVQKQIVPGNVVHCYRNVTQMECVEDGVEPNLGLCRPETCANVLIDSGQRTLFEHRYQQVTEWLGIPRLPDAQRRVLERRQKRLAAQLTMEPSNGQ